MFTRASVSVQVLLQAFGAEQVAQGRAEAALPSLPQMVRRQAERAPPGGARPLPGGVRAAARERAKLKKITFEEVAICQDGFIVCGADENLNWFANNIPSRCFRVSDVLKGRNIQ